MATVQTSADFDPETHFATIDHAGKREEAAVLDGVFRAATGWEPRLWGGRIIGYGSYAYRYDSGREGVFCATGFATAKAKHSIHILPGYGDFGDILARLGKHKTGASCVYVNKLADIDLDVLDELIKAGLNRLGTLYPVSPS